MRWIPYVFALLLAWNGTTVRAEPDKKTRAQVQQLFDDSEKAYKAGQFEKSADLLKKAYQLIPDPTLLYNLGRSLEGMGDLEGAVDNYERYLKEAKKVDDRGAIERRIDTLKAQIAKQKHDEELHRQQEAEAKRQQEELQRKQQEEAEAKRKLEEQLKKQQELEAQRQHDAEHHDDQVVTPPPPTHDEPDGSSDRVRAALPWATIGAGGVLILSDVLFGLRASSNHDDAVNEPSQQRAQDLQNDATRDATIANVLFVIGGAVAIGGGVWEYLDSQRDAGRREARRKLKLSPTGVAFEWSFP